VQSPEGNPSDAAVTLHCDMPYPDGCYGIMPRLPPIKSESLAMPTTPLPPHSDGTGCPQAKG